MCNFDLKGEYSFASYLIRIKLNQKVNPYYVNYVVNSRIGRAQIDLMSRQILGQANINSQELKEIVLPIPPIEVQNKIVKHINECEAVVTQLRFEAVELSNNAIQQFESKIFEK
jgi:type I restriction enzyme, S subunit